jgi:hypothetical protein
MGRDGLADPGAAGGLADDPPGAVPVQSPAVCCQENWPVRTVADGQVDRPGGPRRQWDGHDLAALADNRESPVPALQAQVLDVGSGCPETRSPFSASSEISACSDGGPSPAATRSAPSSLRSSATAWDS